jgi:hypothetical protein
VRVERVVSKDAVSERFEGNLVVRVRLRERGNWEDENEQI